jgi:hypothetical protein
MKDSSRRGRGWTGIGSRAERDDDAALAPADAAAFHALFDAARELIELLASDAAEHTTLRAAVDAYVAAAAAAGVSATRIEDALAFLEKEHGADQRGLDGLRTPETPSAVGSAA